MRVKVTGSTGKLGKVLVPMLKDNDFDIVDYRPHVVIHLAAMTNVDRCEMQPKIAYEANVNLTRYEALAHRDSYFIYLSTDFVFNGTRGTGYLSTDQPDPLSVYGQTKYLGECAARAANPKTVIIRTSWLFDDSVSFQDKAIADQIGCPTYTKDLARHLIDGVLSGLVDFSGGILHITNRGEVSWHEFAQEVAKHLGSKQPIEPISRKTRIAARPENCVLIGSKLRSWKSALKEAIYGTARS